MLLLAGCNGSTKGCREPYRERKGILGISWRIESFKLIFPRYDDCRNPGIIAEDDWKLFLFDGVKNAGAELDYDLIEPQLPAGSPRPFSISEYEFEPGDFTALRLDNVCAKPGVRYCIEFKRKGSRPKATRVRVYLIVKPDVDWERRMMFPDDLAGQIVGKHHPPFPVHVGLDDQIDPDPRRFRPASLALELYAIADARLGADVIESQGSEVAGLEFVFRYAERSGRSGGQLRLDQVVIQFRSGVFHSVEQEELPVVFGYYAGIPAIVVSREDQLERFDSP